MLGSAVSRNQEFNEPTILSGEVDSGYRDLGEEERWVGLRRPSGPTAVAKLTGGYIYPPRSGNWRTGYEAFPDGQAQGELFNLRQPRITGWYKSQDTSAADAMNVLGVAAEESKRRYGAYPQPDGTLSEDSAPIVSKLAGRTVQANYNVGAEREDRQELGTSLANTIADKLEEEERAGKRPIKKHTAEDLDAGRRLVRTMSAMRRGIKPATAPSSPSAVKGKQFPDSTQLTIPGL
jgi:hypothetical protein